MEKVVIDSIRMEELRAVYNSSGIVKNGQIAGRTNNLYSDVQNESFGQECESIRNSYDFVRFRRDSPSMLPGDTIGYVYGNDGVRIYVNFRDSIISYLDLKDRLEISKEFDGQTGVIKEITYSCEWLEYFNFYTDSFGHGRCARTYNPLLNRVDVPKLLEWLKVSYPNEYNAFAKYLQTHRLGTCGKILFWTPETYDDSSDEEWDEQFYNIVNGQDEYLSVWIMDIDKWRRSKKMYRYYMDISYDGWSRIIVVSADDLEVLADYSMFLED